MSVQLRSLVRARFLDMPAYEPILPHDVLSRRLGIPPEQIIKLDANENPFGPLPAALHALAGLDQAHIYPDPESRRIRSMLAEYHQIEASTIIIGAGADELIDLIMRLTIDPGDRLINCPPTFGMYAFDGVINGAEVISVPRRSDFTLDMDALYDTVVATGPKLLFLAHPNNPDGKLVPPEFIDVLLTLPLLVVLDEAYIDFSPGGSSWICRVADYENLIVLRTFSKWAGLAGLRVGYGVVPETLAPLLMKVKQPYSVSVAAEAAAYASIVEAGMLHAHTAAVVRERERLMRELGQIPWLEPVPSAANFILCRVFGRAASRVRQKLMEQGILIRYFDRPGLVDSVRISVGTRAQNSTLITALRELEEEDEAGTT